MIVATRPLCLSPRREAILIALYRLARPTPWGLGHPPSVRAIQRAVGHRTESATNYQLRMLETAGLARRLAPSIAHTWRPNYERVLYVTQDGVTTVSEQAAGNKRAAGKGVKERGRANLY